MFYVSLRAKLRKARQDNDFSYMTQNTNLQFIYKKFAQSVLKETGYEILHIFFLKKVLRVALYLHKAQNTKRNIKKVAAESAHRTRVYIASSIGRVVGVWRNREGMTSWAY